MCISTNLSICLSATAYAFSYEHTYMIIWATPQIFFCRTIEKLGRTLEPCDLKAEILAWVGLSPMLIVQLSWAGRIPVCDQVVERVVVDRLLQALSRSMRRPVSMRNPLDIAELIEAMELADASFAHDTGEREGLAPRRVEWCTLEGTSSTVSRPGPPILSTNLYPPNPQITSVGGQLQSPSYRSNHSPRTSR